MEPNTPKEIARQIERLGISTWGDILTTKNTIAETLAKDSVLGPFFQKYYVRNTAQMTLPG